MNSNEYDVIIRNGTVVTADKTFKGDIGIRDGKVVELCGSLPVGTVAKKEIDAAGMHVMPGVIDTHVHADDPGRTEWETFGHVTKSLAAGGATTFFDMPLNSIPYTNDAAAFDVKKKVADENCLIDFSLLGGATPDNIGNMAELKEKGVLAFKGFLCFSGIAEYAYLEDDALMAAMEKMVELDSILMLHAENAAITTRLGKKAQAEGRVTPRDFVDSRPVACEITSAQKALSMAEATGGKVHVVHASCADVVEVVTRAKERGTDATVETCPQYLALTVNDFDRIGMLGKCCPPIREPHHVEALWEAVRDGQVDTIGSDHSPSPPEAKLLVDGKTIFTIFGGMSMAQSTLNVMLEEGYFRRGIPLETIVRVTAKNPAKRFGLHPRKGDIDIGFDADIIIVDLNDSFTLKKSDLYYKHPQSPFEGKHFRGKVKRTLVRGGEVYNDGVFDESFKGKMV